MVSWFRYILIYIFDIVWVDQQTCEWRVSLHMERDTNLASSMETQVIYDQHEWQLLRFSMELGCRDMNIVKWWRYILIQMGLTCPYKLEYMHNDEIFIWKYLWDLFSACPDSHALDADELMINMRCVNRVDGYDGYSRWFDPRNMVAYPVTDWYV